MTFKISKASKASLVVTLIFALLMAISLFTAEPDPDPFFAGLPEPGPAAIGLELAALLERQVFGIITDYPDRPRAVMAERGMTLPPAYE